MPLNEFWHGDMRLLNAYAKAYRAHTSYTAWLQGNYNQIAHEIALANAFAKKGAKRAEYPKWKSPNDELETKCEQKPKQTVTKENLEEVFRQQQTTESAWFSEFINK